MLWRAVGPGHSSVKLLSEPLGHLETLQENGKLQTQTNPQGTILTQAQESTLGSCHATLPQFRVAM